MLIFFLTFLVIYYGAKVYVFWRFKQKAEGFGFGDVIMAGILGSAFPVFLPLSSALQRGYLICSYLIMSCLIGILFYVVGKRFTSFTTSHTSQTVIPIAASEKVLPFLPAMSCAFVLFICFGQDILKFLVSF
jgi:hypothetical protein